MDNTSCSFIALADVHVGWNLFNFPEIGNDTKLLFKDVCDVAISRKVKYLILVGDTFDTNKPTPENVAFVRRLNDYLKEGGVTGVCIAGDHDMPLNGTSWIRDVTGFKGFEEINDSSLLGFDFDNNPANILNKIQNHPTPQNIEFFFLHCQLPQMWEFCDERKEIDFSKLALEELYPNLKCIVLGDIHKPTESKILLRGGKEIDIKYCGSLNVVKQDEIHTKTGVIYYDGKTISRIPIPLKREFIQIDLTVENFDELKPQQLIDKFREADVNFKPLFIVKYNDFYHDRLKLISGLYKAGLVKTQKKSNIEIANQRKVSVRSELKHGDSMAEVLKKVCSDAEVNELLLQSLTTEEPTMFLNQFRSKYIQHDQ